MCSALTACCDGGVRQAAAAETNATKSPARLYVERPAQHTTRQLLACRSAIFSCAAGASYPATQVAAGAERPGTRSLVCTVAAFAPGSAAGSSAAVRFRCVPAIMIKSPRAWPKFKPVRYPQQVTWQYTALIQVNSPVPVMMYVRYRWLVCPWCSSMSTITFGTEDLQWQQTEQAGKAERQIPSATQRCAVGPSRYRHVLPTHIRKLFGGCGSDLHTAAACSV